MGGKCTRRWLTGKPHTACPTNRISCWTGRGSIDGPELAAQAINAGLVDEFQMIVCPVIVGGGKRFFPAGARLALELVEERRLSNTVVLRYAVRS
jgi:hypothetical protein